MTEDYNPLFDPLSALEWVSFPLVLLGLVGAVLVRRTLRDGLHRVAALRSGFVLASGATAMLLGAIDRNRGEAGLYAATTAMYGEPIAIVHAGVLDALSRPFLVGVLGVASSSSLRWR